MYGKPSAGLTSGGLVLPATGASFGLGVMLLLGLVAVVIGLLLLRRATVVRSS